MSPAVEPWSEVGPAVMGAFVKSCAFWWFLFILLWTMYFLITNPYCQALSPGYLLLWYVWYCDSAFSMRLHYLCAVTLTDLSFLFTDQNTCWMAAFVMCLVLCRFIMRHFPKREWVPLPSCSCGNSIKSGLKRPWRRWCSPVAMGSWSEVRKQPTASGPKPKKTLRPDIYLLPAAPESFSPRSLRSRLCLRLVPWT